MLNTFPQGSTLRDFFFKSLILNCEDLARRLDLCELLILRKLRCEKLLLGRNTVNCMVVVSRMNGLEKMKE